MTKLLEEAFAQAARLSDQRQDELASLVLEEIAAEQHWEDRFTATQDQLARLADAALAEFDAGLTKPVDENCDLPHD